MAHVDDGGGKGRRSANVDVNIVPVIDLMSVLIIFLLISAVWTQTSMIQIGSSIYGKKTTDEVAPPTPKLEIPLRVDIKDYGYRLVIGKKIKNFPKVGSEYDRKSLRDELIKIKELYPDKVDSIITISDDLLYDDLINGMDVVITAGFSEVGIATAGVK